MEEQPIAFAEISDHFSFQAGITVRRATYGIRAGLCRYWLAEGGPCTMCPLPTYQKDLLGGVRPSWNELQPAFEQAWHALPDPKPEVVRIFHGGNFIVEDEVSPESQVNMVRFLSAQPPVHRIIVESKPEYITQERIARLVASRERPVRIQVNMGVESSNQGVRDCLRKGFTDKQYREAVALLRDFDVDRLAYLIIQPIGVPPEYAIHSLMESVCWVTDIDSETEVSVLALYVDRKTIAYKAWERGEFTPPSLPTVAHAVIAAREVHPKGWVSFGGVRDNDVIEPAAYSKGCATCHDPLMAALKCYYTDCEIEPLKKALASVTPCGCG